MSRGPSVELTILLTLNRWRRLTSHLYLQPIVSCPSGFSRIPLQRLGIVLIQMLFRFTFQHDEHTELLFFIRSNIRMSAYFTPSGKSHTNLGRFRDTSVKPRCNNTNGRLRLSIQNPTSVYDDFSAPESHRNAMWSLICHGAEEAGETMKATGHGGLAF